MTSASQPALNSDTNHSNPTNPMSVSMSAAPTGASVPETTNLPRSSVSTSQASLMAPRSRRRPGSSVASPVPKQTRPNFTVFTPSSSPGSSAFTPPSFDSTVIPDSVDDTDEDKTSNPE